MRYFFFSIFNWFRTVVRNNTNNNNERIAHREIAINTDRSVSRRQQNGASMQTLYRRDIIYYSGHISDELTLFFDSKILLPYAAGRLERSIVYGRR